MTLPYEHEREIALQAVREAARLCRAVRGELAPGVLEKKDLSPVTVADYGSQALICRALGEAFPADPIIAEEDSAELREANDAQLFGRLLRQVRAIRPVEDDDELCAWIDRGGSRSVAGRFWTLDPIDGTKGFLRNEQYAVSLALIVEGQIQVAAMACPNLPLGPEGSGRPGTVFLAVRGRGATMQPLAGDAPEVPIQVDPAADPASARFCESVESGHSAHGDAAAVAARLGIVAPPVRLDSQAKYAVVARGEAAIYLRLPTRPNYREAIWDHAGGVLIVTEAGGTVTDVAGRPLDFTQGPRLEANRGVIATNGPWHDRVLETLRGLGLADGS